MDNQFNANLKNDDTQGRISRVSPDEQELAWDPNTSPQVLHQLGKSSDPLVRQGLAGNPNTPVQLLQQLGTEFPQIVVRNPILPLLFLENYQIIDELIPQANREQLVVNVDTPREILGMLVHSAIAPIAEAARLHINWQEETGKGWQEVWRERLTAIGNCEDYKRFIFEMGLGVKIGLLNDSLIKGFPDHFLGMLAQAGSSDTPTETLESLAKSESLLVRVAVAANSQTPLHVLEKLIQDPCNWVRGIVMFNPNVSLELLSQLERDSQEVFIFGVKINLNVRVDVLKRLINHERFTAKLTLARHPKTPIDILQKVAEEKEPLSRYDLIYNPNLPRVTWEELAGDVIGHDYEYVATNPKMPVFILDQLVHHPERKVRLALAKNHRLPDRLYEVLAQDPDVIVRQGLAFYNWSIPIQVMEQLLSDRECYQASTQFSSDLQHLLLLADRYLQRNPSGLRFVLECFAQYAPETLVRVIALLHPDTPTSVLVASANDFDWVVRGAIATNPQTPREILQQLAQDANWVVRGAAQSALEKDAG